MIDLSAFVKSLNGQPVAVFGLGVSGQATVNALTAAGATVYIDDDNKELILHNAKEGGRVVKDLAGRGGGDTQLGRVEAAEFSGEEGQTVLEQCACLILSPGVPLYHPAPHPVVVTARAAGTEIICDIELFGLACPNAKTIGITGTNGKSTTAALLYHVLQECGMASQLGGNIGRAVMGLNDPAADEIIVLELSSYQLDLCPTFSPDIAVLLNITPDHLDRHGSIENYAASKAHIFEGPGTAVIATDDGFTKAIAETTQSKGARQVMRVSAKDIDFETPALRGEHNKQNIAAVMAVAQILALDIDKVRAAIERFPGLPHRQFLVREIGGITFINDSKATNAEATSKALAAFDDIYWIVGGQPKEGGLSGLEHFTPKIHAAFVIGEAAIEGDHQRTPSPREERAGVRGQVQCTNQSPPTLTLSPEERGDFVGQSFPTWLSHQGLHYVKSNVLEQAIQDVMIEIEKDRAVGKIKDATVLLSPACASWDQFKSFEDRGEQFMELVHGL